MEFYDKKEAANDRTTERIYTITMDDNNQPKCLTGCIFLVVNSHIDPAKVRRKNPGSISQQSIYDWATN